MSHRLTSHSTVLGIEEALCKLESKLKSEGLWNKYTNMDFEKLKKATRALRYSIETASEEKVLMNENRLKERIRV